MKQLIIFPKGTLSAKDKERMSKEGYLAIEADEPSKVVMPLPSGSLMTGEILTMSLLTGIMKGGYNPPKQAFFDDLALRILGNEVTK